MKTIASNFYCLLRREMWEHKGAVIYLPVGIAAALLILQLLLVILGAGEINTFVDQAENWRQGSEVEPDGFDVNGMGKPNFYFGIREFTRISLVSSGNIILFIAYVVSIVYAIGALYTDRKDRSILFWKSMPLSEGKQVFSKLIFTGVVIPGVAFATILVLMFLSTLVSTTTFAGSDHYTWISAWQEIDFFSVAGYYLALFPIVVLISIPGITWFLLASAFAKKSPGILAFLIPIVIVLFERFLLGTTYAGNFILDAFGFYFLENSFGFNEAEDWQALASWSYLHIFIPSVGDLLKMFALMAVCLPGAIWLRNHRYEI